MSKKNFFKQLGIGSAILIICLYFIHQLPVFQGFFDFSMISIVLFIIFCIGMYFFGYSAAVSTNKSAFTGIVLISIFGKMLFSIILIVVYSKLREPETRMFLLPFIVVYLYYTAFETYFLMKLGKLKPGSHE